MLLTFLRFALKLRIKSFNKERTTFKHKFVFLFSIQTVLAKIPGGGGLELMPRLPHPIADTMEYFGNIIALVCASKLERDS
jgi:hypothetical protein